MDLSFKIFSVNFYPVYIYLLGYVFFSDSLCLGFHLVNKLRSPIKAIKFLLLKSCFVSHFELFPILNSVGQ